MSKGIQQNNISLKLSEIATELYKLLKDKYFYIGAFSLIIGTELNFFAQRYLLDFIQDGNSLPALPDLILDNIPMWDIDFLCDIFSVVSVLVLVIFIIHKRIYSSIPYILLVTGIFQIFRGVFIVLTPFGNPIGFDGTEGLLHGFTDIELGVYPSGHIGTAFLYFLFVKGKTYRYLILISVLVITIGLFLSRGHYTIDILSGIIFAYAIKCFGDKHLLQYVDPTSANKNLNSCQ